MKLEATEKQIQNSILDWLRANKIFCWPENTTGIYDPRKRVFRLNPRMMRGVPDIIAVYKGRIIGIEVKSATGKISEHQHIFSMLLQEAGGHYTVAKSVDDVERYFKWFKESI